MTNRPAYSPIFLGVVLALAASSTLVVRGQSAPPLPPATNSAPAATPAPTPAPAEVSPAPAEQPATYTVVAGDSLWKIAHKYHTSVTKLKKLNKLTTNNLKPGQVLQLPPAKGTPSSAPAAKSASHHKAKTMQQTPPEVAGAVKAEPEPAAQPPADAAALAPLTADVPSATAPAAAATAPTEPSQHHPIKPVEPEEPEVAGTYRAQPVQDFDVPASTFASCPVPVPVEPDAAEASPAPAIQPAPPAASEPMAQEESPAPRAALVSPSELAAQSTPPAPAATPSNPPAPVTSPAPDGLVSNESSKHSGDAMVTDSTAGNGENSLNSTASGDWADRFTREARDLADRDIDYDEDWRPPGESRAWAMDCSNTARYLYKITAGIELPRTASDQYYYLHLQNKAWDVPQTANGFADTSYLRDNLKPGDLLFWENTYRPERQPPITHVMIFLGTNERGQWIMAGSQTSRGGLHNRRHGGPDIYVFDPTRPCGGYSTWLGLVHHQGRFCAFGRPLAADPSKLAVAANN